MTGAWRGAPALEALVREALPVGLAVVAEGAWIAVPYTLVQSARGESVWLGPIGLAAFAAAGVVAARLLSGRAGDRWPVVAVGLVVVGALTGWLVDAQVRAWSGAGDLGSAVARHQAGALAGLAVLRGIPHAVPAASERALGRALTWGTPFLALPLILGRALDEPARSSFEGQALVDCLLFLLAGSLGLAFVRVARLGRASGFAWSRNRSWIALAVLAAAGALVALPLAFVAGPTVRLVVAIALPPLLLVAIVASVRQITLRTVGIVAAVGVLVFAISRLNFSFAPNTQPGTPTPVLAGPNAQDPVATVVTWLPIIAAVVLVIAFLARRWLRGRVAAPPVGVVDERWTEAPGGERTIRPRLHWPRASATRRAAPTDAAEAYLAALDLLDRDGTTARGPAETPAAHARRLRSAGDGSLAFELLAADYELARFGDSPLTPAEHRRALDRWRRLRAVPRR